MEPYFAFCIASAVVNDREGPIALALRSRQLLDALAQRDAGGLLAACRAELALECDPRCGPFLTA